MLTTQTQFSLTRRAHRATGVIAERLRATVDNGSVIRLGL